MREAWRFLEGGATSRLGRFGLASLLSLTAVPALADEAADQALISAIYAGNMRAMQTALRQGGSFNARDVNGYTPLHWAAFRGYVVLAGYLLDRGAAIDPSDNNGYTPLMLAAWNGHDTVVRLLLARGASRERLSLDGFTALDYSQTQGHHHLRALLEPTRSPYGVPVARASLAPAEAEGAPFRPRSPRTPGPVKTPFPRVEPVHHFEPVAGLHLARVQFPIVGVHYRLRLQEWFSLRLGTEYGRSVFSQTGPLDLAFVRMQAAVVTNGPLYLGVGATHLTLGSLSAGGYNPSIVYPEVITGLRLGWGPLSASTELRLGWDGPSTVTGGIGGRF
ncbi:MAG: ankyrin repeat domain-containing protein [Candidatus Sericytochromatia bacterium]|nr:ankyrin repeat domain-containing protein [Candidatus Sericytochromatia bacterium]